MRTPTPHEKSLIDAATDCVAKCNLPGLLITETKFLQLESLQVCLLRFMLTFLYRWLAKRLTILMDTQQSPVGKICY